MTILYYCFDWAIDLFCQNIKHTSLDAIMYVIYIYLYFTCNELSNKDVFYCLWLCPYVMCSQVKIE